MAIDTENKRRSAYVGLGLWCVAPRPDGAIDASDRAQARFVYRGLIDEGPFGGGNQVVWRPIWVPRRRG